MTKLKLISCAGAFACFGAMATAHAGTASDYFGKYDSNADGVVTEAEFVAVKTASGKVTAAEAQEKFTRIAGTDGQMTLAELQTAMEPKATSHDCSKSKDKTA